MKSAPQRSEIKGLFLRSLLLSCFRSLIAFLLEVFQLLSAPGLPAAWAPLEFGVEFSAPVDTSYRWEPLEKGQMVAASTGKVGI